MTTLIFSNADYYKNEKFQELMREWNNIDYFKDDPKIYEQVKENLMNDFYRKGKEWLFSLDGTNIDNYSSLAWKVGLE
jgi:hypothetical protein|tara:strand:+ start:404 stop:637 length:234 start_codon:yes stop_codon:yes gene_type:complete